MSLLETTVAVQAAPAAPPGTGLRGRNAECRSLERLIADVNAGRGRAMILHGEAGVGKTALLEYLAARASDAGCRVMRSAGVQSEMTWAFAGLHQLLRPVIAASAGLPGHLRAALQGALGLAAGSTAGGKMLIGVAALSLISAVSADSPLLILVDDAQWIDASSLDVLAFAAHRLEGQRVAVVVAGRGQVPPPGFESGFPRVVRLEALSAADASELLDAQPSVPRGRARELVLGQAAGSPMAIVELAKAVASDPSAGQRHASGPVLISGRVAAELGPRLAALPDPTRSAILVAAAADDHDLTTATGAMAALDARALVPAEKLGLVRIDHAGLRFTHPLLRSAAYHAAPFTDRAAAHLALAAMLHDRPDRRAWHLAAATLLPDAEIADLLEATSDQARRHSGAAAAVAALERAAELSPDPEDRARRFVSASHLAISTGQADWVRDLARRALALTADPELRLAARYSVGWALTWSGQRTAAFSMLVSVTEEAAARRSPLAWDALATAATVAYHSGTAADRQAVSALLARVSGEQAGCSRAGTERERSEAAAALVQASSNPLASRSRVVPVLGRLAGLADERSLLALGMAAWLFDEPDLAVRLLRAAMARLEASGIRGTSGQALTALGWVCVDTGRWDEALAVSARALDLAEAYEMDMIGASAALISATVLALRGDSHASRAHAARALAAMDPAESRLIVARECRAAGMAAASDDAPVTAYVRHRQLFGPGCQPLHPGVSYYGLADLAAAAIRADRRAEGHDLLRLALRDLGGTLSPRLGQILGRARGLLAEPPGAEAHFAAALSDADGERWPFERAQLRLDYGEWLRRQRRINEAKPLFVAALETFRMLGARPCAQRAETELRACGVAGVATPQAPGGAMAGLTPQQREIVYLASSGLTNRQIAHRLYLSPHTVAAHLYRSYPQLGVAGRHQLREVIDGERDLASTARIA